MSRRNQPIVNIPDELIIDNSGDELKSHDKPEMIKQESVMHIVPLATLHGSKTI